MRWKARGLEARGLTEFLEVVFVEVVVKNLLWLDFNLVDEATPLVPDRDRKETSTRYLVCVYPRLVSINMQVRIMISMVVSSVSITFRCFTGHFKTSWCTGNST